MIGVRPCTPGGVGARGAGEGHLYAGWVGLRWRENRQIGLLQMRAANMPILKVNAQDTEA